MLNYLILDKKPQTTINNESCKDLLYKTINNIDNIKGTNYGYPTSRCNYKR